MAQSKKQAAETGLKYRKGDILKADCIRPYRDAAEAVLETGREYTLQEAQDAITKFLKERVR